MNINGINSGVSAMDGANPSYNRNMPPLSSDGVQAFNRGMPGTEDVGKSGHCPTSTGENSQQDSNTKMMEELMAMPGIAGA